MIAAKEKDAFKKAGEKKEDKFSRSSTVRRWGSAAVCVFLSEYLQRNDGGNAACICIFLPGDGSLGQRPEMPENFRSALWVDFGDRCRRRVLHARSDASGADLECRGDREPDADRDVDPAGRFGGGDIKLMAACGGFLGWEMIRDAFVTAVIAAALAVFLLRVKEREYRTGIAMAPFFELGMVLHFLRN